MKAIIVVTSVSRFQDGLSWTSPQKAERGLVRGGSVDGRVPESRLVIGGDRNVHTITYSPGQRLLVERDNRDIVTSDLQCLGHHGGTFFYIKLDRDF